MAVLALFEQKHLNRNRMHRDIKFRAWDDSEKKWLLGYELPNLGGFSIFGEVMLFGEWSQCFDEFIFERNGKKSTDLVVEQFTGLKDKTGKDIYEGDICSCESELIPFKIKAAVIIWDDAMFSAKVGSMQQTLPLYALKVEVIGNIHENPELLK